LSCSLFFEKKASKKGFSCIAGLDEAGRGSLCGPVVAGAVVFPQDLFIKGLDDSKKLTARSRELMFHKVINFADDIGVGLVRAKIIDKINILKATKIAMKRAFYKLQHKPDYLLIDALELEEIDIAQLPIIRGDQKSQSIAAASIVAKVIRDRIMEKWDLIYPEYQFKKNKGYATSEHIHALNKFGPTEMHRMTFRKVFDCRVLL